MEGPVYFFEKPGQKKPSQELILESRSEKKKVYFWVFDHYHDCELSQESGTSS
jgi:hypothetical protein